MFYTTSYEICSISRQMRGMKLRIKRVLMALNTDLQKEGS